MIDEATISLGDFIDGEGDTEIGLSWPKAKMDAFASIFAYGLKECERQTFSVEENVVDIGHIYFSISLLGRISGHE